MFVYSSVRSSTWDVDSLVTQLNEMAAQGWDVVNVVNTGSDLAAILRRPMTSSASAVAATPAAAAVATSVIDTTGYGSSSAALSPSSSSTNSTYGSSTVAPTASASPAAVVAPAATVTPPVAAASVAPASTTPAGWYPDPSGRFEMRYWDGNGWTEHVARQGQQYTDPPVA
jgi:Protein of unknown function (DUF2510)